MLKHIYQTDEAGQKKPGKKQSAYDAMKEQRSNAWKGQPTQEAQQQQGGKSALKRLGESRAAAWRNHDG